MDVSLLHTQGSALASPASKRTSSGTHGTTSSVLVKGAARTAVVSEAPSPSGYSLQARVSDLKRNLQLLAQEAEAKTDPRSAPKPVSGVSRVSRQSAATESTFQRLKSFQAMLKDTMEFVARDGPPVSDAGVADITMTREGDEGTGGEESTAGLSERYLREDSAVTSTISSSPGLSSPPVASLPVSGLVGSSSSSSGSNQSSPSERRRPVSGRSMSKEVERTLQVGCGESLHGTVIPPHSSHPLGSTPVNKGFSSLCLQMTEEQISRMVDALGEDDTQGERARRVSETGRLTSSSFSRYTASSPPDMAGNEEEVVAVRSTFPPVL